MTQVYNLLPTLQEKSFDYSGYTTIAIPFKEQKTLKHLTIDKYPQEACAFLFGNLRNSNIIIREVNPIINSLQSFRAFAIKKHDIEKIKPSKDLVFIGFYHSHLKKLYPSPHDVDQMKRNSFPWLIGSLRKINGYTLLKLKAYNPTKSYIYSLKIINGDKY